MKLRDQLVGKKVVCVMTSGNIDLAKGRLASVTSLKYVDVAGAEVGNPATIGLGVTTGVRPPCGTTAA